MKSLTIFILLGIGVTIANFLFSLIQIKDFNKNYAEMRRKGKVAIGRRRGYIQAGTVVLFLIDNSGIIIDARKIQGVSVFARVRKFAGLQGKSLGDITKKDLNKYNIYMKAAVLDAVKNYNVFKGGGEIKEKDTSLFKGINKLIFRREKV